MNHGLDNIRIALSNSPLVQLVERRTVNPYVAGSSPAGGAKFKKKDVLGRLFLYLNLAISRNCVLLTSFLTHTLEVRLRRSFKMTQLHQYWLW